MSQPISTVGLTYAEPLAPVPDYDWLTDFASQPSEVLRICDSPDKSRLLQLAIGIAKGEYPSGSIVRVEIENDPEGERESLSIRSTAKASIDEVLVIHDRVVEKWIGAAPASLCNFICFTFGFA